MAHDHDYPIRLLSNISCFPRSARRVPQPHREQSSEPVFEPEARFMRPASWRAPGGARNGGRGRALRGVCEKTNEFANWTDEIANPPLKFHWLKEFFRFCGTGADTRGDRNRTPLRMNFMPMARLSGS